MLRDNRFFLKNHYQNSYALIIGIDHYEIASPLSYAVNDAQEVGNVLSAELDFPKNNITYLFDKDATRDNIRRSFLRFAKHDIENDDRLFVFFAGHGHTVTGYRGEVGYLVPFDADVSDIVTMIKWGEFTGNADLIHAKHILFIMDACYGGLALGRGLPAGSSRFLKDMMRRYSRQVLTAGKADEVVADSGGPLPGHSVFTGHLIEGLKGKAFMEHEILTANGLMSYVYGKVANDKNSHQTPHYGHIEGDGDFILKAPDLFKQAEIENKEKDSLIVVPFFDEIISGDTTESKIKKVKSLLTNESSSIELHDFITNEIKRFLSETTEEHSNMPGTFNKNELFERITKLENISSDLSLISACIAYWGKPVHKQILRKILSRSTDNLWFREGGLIVWIYLRWYPIILELYCTGISSVLNKRYDSLIDIFQIFITEGSEYGRREKPYIEFIYKAIMELNRVNVFKEFPGYERRYTPMSDYLFKLLQPKLDDVFFIGREYESSFDEFEVMFALAVADLQEQKGNGIWGPVGRFGWDRLDADGPLNRIINNAHKMGETWDPIKNGFYGGNINRFFDISEKFRKSVLRLGWL